MAEQKLCQRGKVDKMAGVFTFLGQKSNKRPLAQNNGLPHSLSKWMILKAGSAFVPKANAPLPLRAPP